jgi:ketosteroid isomerase-like protein
MNRMHNLIPLLCLAAIVTPSLSPAAPAAATALAAEEARAAALRSGDTTALAALLSNDLRYVHSNGRLESKADILGGLAGKSVAYERYVVSEIHAAQVAPGVVVLNGRIDQRKLTRGQWGDAQLFFHAVWRDEAGQWRLVSMHTAAAPAKP